MHPPDQRVSGGELHELTKFVVQAMYILRTAWYKYTIKTEGIQMNEIIETAITKMRYEMSLSVRRSVARTHVTQIMDLTGKTSSQAWATMYEGLRVRNFDMYKGA